MVGRGRRLPRPGRPCTVRRGGPAARTLVRRGRRRRRTGRPAPPVGAALRRRVDTAGPGCACRGPDREGSGASAVGGGLRHVLPGLGDHTNRVTGFDHEVLPREHGAYFVEVLEPVRRALREEGRADRRRRRGGCPDRRRHLTHGAGAVILTGHAPCDAPARAPCEATAHPPRDAPAHALCHATAHRPRTAHRPHASPIGNGAPA